MRISTLLDTMTDINAAEIRLVPGHPPQARVDGSWKAVDGQGPVSQADVDELAGLASEDRRDALSARGQVEFSAAAEDGRRFRATVTRAEGGPSASLRVLPAEPLALDDALLPPSLRAALDRRSGLVIVTGPPRSGKTTVLSAFSARLLSKGLSVAALEDPAELPDAGPGLERREVGRDASSFAEGAAWAVRAGRDALVMTRLPDEKAAREAVAAAASGLMVIVEMPGLRTLDACGRFIEMSGAPSAFARAFLGAASVRLLRGEAGHVPVFETISASQGINATIAETGRMPGTLPNEDYVSIESALLDAVAEKRVPSKEALAAAPNAEDLVRSAALSGVDLDEKDEAVAEASRSAGMTTRMLKRSEMFSDTARPTETTRVRRGFEASPVPPPSAAPAPQADGGNGSAKPVSIAGKKVLVVDDEPGAREVLVRMLEHYGAKVTSVSDPAQAVKALGAETYDIAMFDILMPGISGTELYDRAVAQQPGLRERVTFVTGHSLDNRLIERIASRGGKILRKPFNRDELVQAATFALSEG